METLNILLVQLPPILTSLAALVAAFYAISANANAKVNSTKSDTIIVKAEEIHTLTNSNLHTVQADLQLANQRIEELQKALGFLLEKNHEKVTDPTVLDPIGSTISPSQTVKKVDPPIKL